MAIGNSVRFQGSKFAPEAFLLSTKNTLTPGMSAQVEVRTGDRRVIEYLLTPLIRYKEEAIRER